jgi:hypothetical protein
MKKRFPPKLEKFPAAKQRQLDQLLDRNSEGTITPKQKAKLEQLVAEAERLAAANGKRLVEFTQSERSGPPASAVPVTVWVRAEQTER